MNNLSFQRAVFLLSLASVTGAYATLPAQAETPNENTFATQHIVADRFALDKDILTHAVSQSELPAEKSLTTPKALSQSNSNQESEQLEKQQIKFEPEVKTAPVPGTVNTSASGLLDGAASQTPKAAKVGEVAQYEIEPGRETRSGRSYVGLGGNIGLTGQSGLGDAAFSLFAKIGLTRVLSVRPMVVIADDVDFIIPVTYDFAIEAEPFNRLVFAPYVGAGIIISTYEESNVGVVLTGGFDFPITERFTGVGSVTIGFIDTTSIGLLLGIAYNFAPGFQF